MTNQQQQPTMMQPTIQQRLTEAEQAMATARYSAEVYHGWSSVHANNAYNAAKRELRAVRREARMAMTAAESDPREGRGAFGWAILSALLVIGVVVGEFSAHVLR